jgi:hypothetical protein
LHHLNLDIYYYSVIKLEPHFLPYENEGFLVRMGASRQCICRRCLEKAIKTEFIALPVSTLAG